MKKRRHRLSVCLAFPMFFSSLGLGAQITIKAKNQKVVKIIESIEKESGYNFFYSNNLTNLNKKKDLNVDNLSLEQTLNKLLANTNIDYEIRPDKQVVLMPEKQTKTESLQDKKKENVTQGVVSDATTGETLIGVSILNERTKKGTVTDLDGKYSIDAIAGDILSFSYVGYATQEMKVGKDELLDIRMKVNTELEEVVVVGYGTQQRKTITGAVATVNSSDIIKAPAADMTNAIAGRLPGLRAINRSGEPGSNGADIDIRGFGSALIIVDGVQANFSQLDPNEIESISVLKDASAAVYGVKAANGVVLVTTKRGNESKPKFNFSSSWGWQTPTKYPEYVNAAQFMELTVEDLMNREMKTSNIPSREELQKWREGKDPMYQSTDWYKTIANKYSPQQQYNLNIRGGSEYIKYFTSVGYMYQKGMWKTGSNTFDRYNFRSNVDAKLGKYFKSSVLLSGRLEKRKRPSASTGYIMGSIARNYPTFKPYADSQHKYYGVTNQLGFNPMVLIDDNTSGYRKLEDKVFEGQVSLKYDAPFLPGLTAEGSFYYRTSNTHAKNFSKKYNLYRYDETSGQMQVAYTSDISSLDEAMSSASVTVLRGTIEYKKVFEKKHDFSLLYVAEFRENWSNNLGAMRELIINSLEEINLGLRPNMDNSGFSGESATIGHIGRLNYAYDNKYLLEASFRYDGSSNFPSNSRWGFFPGVSVGWRLTEEDFMKPYTDILSSFKLRASIAKLGDDASGSGFQYLTGYTYPEGGYIFGGEYVTPGLVSKGLANPDITWYTSTISNIGFDFSLWHGMLSGEFDVFKRKRDGLLKRRGLSIPGTFGSKLPLENLDGDSDRGFELLLKHRNTLPNQLSYSVSGNMSYTRSKYEFLEQNELPNSKENWRLNDKYRWKNRTWGYISQGQFQSYDEIANWVVQDGQGNTSLHPGDIKYRDLNHDGVIDENDETIIGRGSMPEIMFGLDISAEWKSFDVSMFFQGATNFNAYFTYESQSPFMNGASSLKVFTDRWHRADLYDRNSEWIPGKYPSTYAGGNPNNTRRSSFWLQDASYVRLKNLQIGYTFPKKWLNHLDIETFRVYVSAYNLFTITGLDLYDPEAPGGRGLYYPQQKIYTVGLNLTF